MRRSAAARAGQIGDGRTVTRFIPTKDRGIGLDRLDAAQRAFLADRRGGTDRGGRSAGRGGRATCGRDGTPGCGRLLAALAAAAAQRRDYTRALVGPWQPRAGAPQCRDHARRVTSRACDAHEVR